MVLKEGIRKANKSPRYLFGFQLFDKVPYEGQGWLVFGRRFSEYFDLRLLNETKVHTRANDKKLELLERSHTFLVERREDVVLFA